MFLSVGFRRHKPLLALLPGLAVLLLAGCGGGGGNATTTGAAAGSGQANTAPGNGSSQSRGSTTTAARGDTSIQDFGQAAGKGDSTSAAGAVHGYLAARAAGNYARACSYLSTAFQQQLGQLAGQAPHAKGPSCPAALAAMTGALPPQIRRDLGVVQITAVRVNGDRAFVLYRGAHGVKSFMPVTKQGNGWKVAALAGSNLG